MSKIGMTTSTFFAGDDFAEGFKRMKKAGFYYADYSGLCGINSEIYKKNNTEFAQYFKEVGKAATDAGITISQAHGIWPVEDTTKELIDAAFYYMNKSIEATALMGCKYIVIHPKLAFGWDDSGHENESYDINMDFFRSLIPAAKENGVVVCIENMPSFRLSVGYTATINKMIDELNEDCFGICLDTGHSLTIKEDPAKTLDKFRDKIKVLHVHDNDGTHDYHLWPFAGVLNWDEFSEVFNTTDIVLSCEAHTPFRLGQKKDALYDDMWRFLTKSLRSIAGE